jgi:hypothetical protein
LQWTWFGRVVHQTYESCVDFTVAEEDFDVDSVDELELSEEKAAQGILD